MILAIFLHYLDPRAIGARSCFGERKRGFWVNLVGVCLMMVAYAGQPACLDFEVASQSVSAPIATKSLTSFADTGVVLDACLGNSGLPLAKLITKPTAAAKALLFATLGAGHLPCTPLGCASRLLGAFDNGVSFLLLCCLRL